MSWEAEKRYYILLLDSVSHPSATLVMERDMKKIHLNLPGNITHVCMTLTRTARMAESQLGTQMLPL